MNQLATDFLKARFYSGQITGEELMRRVEAEVRREMAAETEQLRGERDETAKELAHARERWKWWQKNAEDIAKERAVAWAALRAVEPFFREDMPDGPDGDRGCATPEYRAAYRLVLAGIKDRDALLKALNPIPAV